MSWQKKSPGEASLMLAEYEKLNADLPPNTRTNLAIFVLLPRVGKDALEGLFQRPLGPTPTRHRSWMWYTAMRFSGLGHLWDEFASQRNGGHSMHHCLKWLQSKATQEQWETLGRRLGAPIFEEKPYKGPKTGKWKAHPKKDFRWKLWTKGGVWDRRNNFTRIIVLGEHIERDEPDHQGLEKITPAQLRTLEREIHNRIDQDELLWPDAIREAVEYARWRLPQLAGWNGFPRFSLKAASWFFQEPVPRGGKEGSIDHTSDYHDWSTTSRNAAPWWPEEDDGR